MEKGVWAAATHHYAWLWANMHVVDPAYSGVRGSFVAGEMARLVVAWPPARARFRELRDHAAAMAIGPGAAGWRADWVVLNRVLGEAHRTLAWYDNVRFDSSYSSILGRMPNALTDALLAQGRWADVGRLCHDPLRVLAVYRDVAAHMKSRSGAPAVILDANASWCRNNVGVLLRCLLAAGREADAADVRRDALVWDGSDAMVAVVDREIHRPACGVSPNPHHPPLRAR
ncbi:MAG: hypothetical protein V4850_17500 [Myxococcota bacterium]